MNQQTNNLPIIFIQSITLSLTLNEVAIKGYIQDLGVVAGEVFVDEERLGFFLLTCVQCDQLVRVPGSVSSKAVGKDGNIY